MKKQMWWVWDAGEWSHPSKAVMTSKGWLHAQWRDGTVALVRPGRFMRSETKPPSTPPHLNAKWSQP